MAIFINQITQKIELEIGEYYLFQSSKEIYLIKIISITPEKNYYIECNGKKMWKKHISTSYSQYNDEFVIEHLPKEYVIKLLREQKLERIVDETD